MEFVFLLAGLALGGLLGYFLLKGKASAQSSRGETDFRLLEERCAQLKNESEQLRSELLSSRNRIETLLGDNARWEEAHRSMDARLKEQKAELESLQEKFSREFELVANRVLKRNTEEFNQTSQKNMSDILNPLKEKLKDFEQKVDTVHKESIKQNSTLTEQISGLKSLNEQMSKETVNLTRALKGDSKTQGDWGEVQLEMILEKAGLVKGVHFTTQSSHRDEDGHLKKPDFIINLPEEKHMVIDSKVSLTGYDRYLHEEETEKDAHLKSHVASVRSHIRELGDKNYASLYQINTPDYVLMYIPIEPAFTLALRTDEKLFDEALNRRIVLVTTSTLLATMRTVHFIWKQENLTKNVLEIARQGGAMYDKFAGLLQDLEKIEKALLSSQRAYHDAVGKITGHGGLMSRIEHLRDLGAKTTKDKNIPQQFRSTPQGEQKAIDE